MSNLINRRAVLSGAAAVPALTIAASAANATGLAPDQPDPVAEPGRIVHWRGVKSAHVDARDVTIWLPENQTGPLPVIYAHDGGNLFDSAVSVDDWPLELDRAMGELARSGIGPAIIVGIWSTEHRSREYNSATAASDLPTDVVEALELSVEGPLLSDQYLRFIVEELKPSVDAEFATLAGPQDTYTFGVSMGGLVAVEALVRYPEVFRGAVAMSAHMFLLGPASAEPDFPIPEDAWAEIEAAIGRLASHLPADNGHRLWIDHGTIELDEHYAGSHTALVEGLIAAGWKPTENLEARVYVGTGHHGRWWVPRIEEALRFLLA